MTTKFTPTCKLAKTRRLGQIVNSLPEIATRFDPKTVISGAGGPSVGYFALAAIPARYALELQDWKQAVQLPLRDTPFPYTDAITWFARGLGAARLGQVAPANASVTALRHIRQRLLKANENYWARQVEIQEVAVAAWAALTAGNKEEALRQMKSAAELEDGTEKSAVTPGPLAPARELLGEMLLEMNEPAQALEHFEATLKQGAEDAFVHYMERRTLPSSAEIAIRAKDIFANC